MSSISLGIRASPRIVQVPTRVFFQGALRTLPEGVAGAVEVRSYSKKKGASSARWLERSRNDHHTKEARVAGYKSRAAFKLLNLHAKYNLFKTDGERPQHIVDLGFAPGAWSQVAVQATGGTGNVLGVDILMTRPPPGASSIQGNILSKHTHESIRSYFADEDAVIAGLVRNSASTSSPAPDNARVETEAEADAETPRVVQINGEERIVVEGDTTSYFTKETAKTHTEEPVEASPPTPQTGEVDALTRSVASLSVGTASARAPSAAQSAKMSMNRQFPVDLVISDMLANTTGISFKDHLSSMDLCDAALILSIDLLRPGGTFVCKFYTGKEDPLLQKRLEKVFKRVVREKPVASNTESREYYFVCLDKKPGVTKMAAFS